MTQSEADVFFEPLQAMDRQFLVLEDENTHMHVSGFSVYELAPLRCESGGIDFELFRKAIESALQRIPRYRQKLAYTPIEGHPVWIDDADFSLDYHLRHIALPPPGSDDQLKQTVGWIVSLPVDRSRALWEMWVVEGIEGGEYFAVVTKMHHCMIDGGAGVNLMQHLLRTEPEYELPTIEPFSPRPAPSAATLASYEVKRRLSYPLRALDGIRRFGAENEALVAALGERVSAFRELLEHVLPASKTPINGPLGPQRRVDWLEMPLDEVAGLRSMLDCTLNDLMLGLVTRALRRYLVRRGVALEGLDFRVSIPVNVRRESESEKMGNRVSSWILPLPLAESDPLQTLARISQRTGELKKSHQSVAIEMMMAAAEEMPALLSLNAKAMQGQINLVVTNVPGPPMALYMMGCRVLSMQPLVPLVPGVGLGVAILSYDGTLHWGFQAEYDLVPDLELFVEDIQEALREIEGAAGREPSGRGGGI